MAIQIINTGTSANAGNGDSIRTAFNKVNNNFDFLNGIVLGTSTNFNSGVRDVVKPMLVHDAHQGLTATYSTLNDRIILRVTETGISTFDDIRVLNTATLRDVVMTGTVTMGFVQGFDDVNIIKYAQDGSLNFRMKNTYGLGSSEINMLDEVEGSFNIVHQNSGANNGFFRAGQNYIFDDLGRGINIGRDSNINFYAQQDWNGYTSPALSITSTGTILANSVLYLNSSTFYLDNTPVNISETDITINGSPLFRTLPSTSYTAIVTPVGSTAFSNDTPLSTGGSIDLNAGKINIDYPKQFNFLTNDYTVEWFYYGQAPEYVENTIFNYGDPGNPELTAYYSSATFYVKSKGDVVLSAPLSFPYLFTWIHIAIERQSGILTLYIDGTSVDSTENLDNISTSTVLTIGDRFPEDITPEFKFTGFVTNFRIAKSAIYSGNFTVSTSSLTTSTGTTLLLLATNSSTYLVDSSNSSVSLPLRTEVKFSNKIWTFDTDSVITLPYNGDIVNFDGVSVLGGPSSNSFDQDLNTYDDVTFNKLVVTTTATIGGNVLPAADLAYDLGSTSSQWRSLYVSSSTIYIDNKALSIDENNNITVDGEIVSGGAGSQGYTGSQGYVGSQGEQGFTGSKGDLGYTGSRGNTGYDGSQGDIGYAGSRGNLGYTGSQGDIGYAGSQGDIGYTGSEGGPGQQGNRGYTGSEGLQGTPGLQGLTGAQGVSIVLVGSTDTVTTSTVGLGNAGQGWINTTDGDVYFWNTLTTNWENIGPIVGPQGDLGYTGSRGSQGDIGLPGDLGYTGSQGDRGYDGSRGDVGYAGSQGELGYVGSQGDLGYVGSQGDIGYTGSQGELGYVGSQGDIGYVGSAGPQGDPGPDLYTPETPTDWIGSPTVATFSQGLDELAGRTISLEDSKDRLTTGSYSVVLGADGVLTLPGGNTRIGDVYGAGNDVIAGSTGTVVGVLTQGTGGYAALQWIGDTTTSTTNAAAVIVNSPFSASSGTVQIATGAVNGPVTDNIWEFGANGILTLPNGLTIDGSGTVGNSIQIGGTSTWISVDNEGAPPGFMVATDVGGADHRWLFDPDGTLTAPGHLMPNADLAYDLGSTTTQWRSIYVGTGTIFIGGVALGVNRSEQVTVNGNPIITVSTGGNLTVQGGDTIIGSVLVSDTAPPATTEGALWFNTVEARNYIVYNGQWVDASPTVLAPPDTNPDVESVTFNDNTVQTTAWTGTYSYNNLTDKPVAPTFVGGGGANTWLTAD
jgi:hypothetical protein